GSDLQDLARRGVRYQVADRGDLRNRHRAVPRRRPEYGEAARAVDQLFHRRRGNIGSAVELTRTMNLFQICSRGNDAAASCNDYRTHVKIVESKKRESDKTNSWFSQAHRDAP